MTTCPSDATLFVLVAKPAESHCRSPEPPETFGCYIALMKLVIPALLIALAANTVALAQYVLDAKGRRYQCMPGDWSCRCCHRLEHRCRRCPVLVRHPGSRAGRERTPRQRTGCLFSTVGDCEVRPPHSIVEKSQYGAPG